MTAVRSPWEKVKLCATLLFLEQGRISIKSSLLPQERILCHSAFCFLVCLSDVLLFPFFLSVSMLSVTVDFPKLHFKRYVGKNRACTVIVPPCLDSQREKMLLNTSLSKSESDLVKGVVLFRPPLLC